VPIAIFYLNIFVEQVNEWLFYNFHTRNSEGWGHLLGMSEGYFCISHLGFIIGFQVFMGWLVRELGMKFFMVR